MRLLLDLLGYTASEKQIFVSMDGDFIVPGKGVI